MDFTNVSLDVLRLIKNYRNEMNHKERYERCFKIFEGSRVCRLPCSFDESYRYLLVTKTNRVVYDAKFCFNCNIPFPKCYWESKCYETYCKPCESCHAQFIRLQYSSDSDYSTS